MPQTLLQRWIFAAKPDSWQKLLVPFWLGQFIGLGGHIGSLRRILLAFGLGLLFTVFDLLFIVFLNDWGDREVDAIKRRMFPSSSLKTIPDGVLPAHHLLFAGLGAGACALIVAIVAAILLGRPWVLVAAVASLAIFLAYTFPPIRLNYRGGGELLEMLGVGLVLPWLQANLMGGVAWTAGMALLPGFALLSLASAIASGLSDERSDRAGGKHTVVTAIGNRLSRRAIEGLVWMAALAWAVTMAVGLPWWVAGAGAISVGGHAIFVHRASEAAATDAFDAQRRYKAELHRGILNSAQLVGGLLTYFHVWLGG